MKKILLITLCLISIIACKNENNVGSNVGYQNDDDNPKAIASTLLLGEPVTDDGLTVYSARANTEVVLTGKNSEGSNSPILQFNWEILDANNHEIKLTQKTKNTAAFDAPNVDTLTRFLFELTIIDGNNKKHRNKVAIDVHPADDSDHFLSHPTKAKPNVFFIKAVLEPGQSITASNNAISIKVTEIIHWENRLKQADSLVLNTYTLDALFDTGFTPDYASTELGFNNTHNPTFIVDIPRIDADKINQNFEITETERRIEAYKIDDANIEIIVEFINDAGNNISLYTVDHQGQLINYDRIDYANNAVSSELASSQNTQASIAATDIMDALGIENNKTASRYYDLLDGSNDGSYERLEGWLIHAGFMDSNENWTSNDYAHALYVNNYDLGFARDMYSRKARNGNVYSFVVNYPNLEAGVKGIGEFALVAMEYSENPDPAALTDGDSKNDKIVKFFAYIFDARVGGFKLTRSLNFDGRGEKYIPGSCTGCHQGDSAGKTFTHVSEADLGATFIPWDIGSFLFTQAENTRLIDHTVNADEVSKDDISRYSREAQEDDIRRLNEHALSTYMADPARHVASIELINGWYNSNINNVPNLPTKGTFNEHYIQPGWSEQPELYHGAYAQYCRVCHTQMLPGERTFDSYQKFMDRSDLINQYIFQTAVMPLARLTMDRFWVNFYGETAGAEILKNHLLLTGNISESNAVPGSPVIKVVNNVEEGQEILLGDIIHLDAKASAFAQSFHWSIIQQPNNSTTTLNGSNSSQTSFTIDVAGGEYIVQLDVVNKKGQLTSETFTFTSKDRAPTVICLDKTISVDSTGLIANIPLIESINSASPNIDDDPNLLDYEGDGGIVLNDIISGTYGQAIIDSNLSTFSYQLYDTFVRGDDVIYYQIRDNDGSTSNTLALCDNGGHEGYAKITLDLLNEAEADLIPSDFTAQLDPTNDSDTILLSWNKPAQINPDTYHLYITKDGIEAETPITIDGSQTQYTHTGLTHNTRYSYQLSATVASNESKKTSATAVIRTLSLITNNLTAIPSTTTDSISVSWDKPEANVYQYSIYLDYDAVNNNMAFATINSQDLADSNNPSYTLNNIISGHNYNVSVAALDSSQEAARSQSVFIASIPTQPSQLNLSLGFASDSSIDLDWNDAAGERVSYRVYRYTTGGNTTFDPVNSYFTDSGLTDFTIHSYKITAINAQGKESLATNIESLQTTLSSGETMTPSIASITLASADASEVIINISPATAYDTSEYLLYRHTGPDTSTPATLLNIGLPLNNIYTDTNLVAGMQYTYTLSALYDPGNANAIESARSLPQSITTKSLSVSNISASSSSPTSTQISWQAAVAADVSYQLTRTVNGVTSPPFSATSPYIDSVTDGEIYQYVVIATQDQQSLSSSPTSVTTAPFEPLAPNVVNSGSSDIIVSWLAPDADLGYTYNVQVSENNIDWVNVALNTADLSITDGNKLSGQEYFYRVQAIKNGLTSVWGNSASAQTASLTPSKPIATSSSTNTIDLTWNAPIGATVVEYYVMRNSALVGTVAGTSFQDQGLTAGQAYTYTIQANDGTQTSDSSPSTTKSTRPSAPTNLTSMNGPNPTSSITLLWDAHPATNASVQYEVVNGSGVSQGITSTPSLTLSSLNSFTAYNYQVYSLNAQSERSLTASNLDWHLTLASGSTTPSITAVSKTTSVNDTQELSVAWNAPSETNQTPVKYKIYRYDSSGNSLLNTQDNVTSPYTDTGLTAGTQYTYKVSAFYNPVDDNPSDIEYAQSNAVQGVSKSLTFNAPTVSSISSNQINLNWSADTPEGTVQSVEGYEVYRSLASNSVFTLLAQVSANTLSYNDVSAGAGTQYKYRIKALQSSQSYTTSNSSNIATKPATPIFSNLNSTINSSYFEWNNLGAGYSYDIRYKVNNGSWLTLVTNSTASSYSHSSLTAGYKYTYELTAKRYGESSSTSEQVIYTKPNSPSFSAFGHGNIPTSKITIAWNQPSGGSGTYSYTLERDINTSFSSGSYSKLVDQQISLSYTDTGLSAATRYYYRITAHLNNESSSSIVSNKATKPSQPTGLSINNRTATGYRVNWTDNQLGTYRVYVDGVQQGTTTGSYLTVTGQTYNTTDSAIIVRRERYSEISTNATTTANAKVDYARDVKTCTTCHAASSHADTDSKIRTGVAGGWFPACMTNSTGDCAAHRTTGCNSGNDSGMCFLGTERTLIQTWSSDWSGNPIANDPSY